MQEDIRKKEEEIGKEEEKGELKEEKELEKEEAEKELEESELTQERPPEKKKYLKFATGLIPGAIAPIIAVFLHSNDHLVWAIPLILISFAVIWIYDGAVSGTFVYLIAAGAYGFWQGNWLASVFFFIVYIICIAIHFIKYFPAAK